MQLREAFAEVVGPAGWRRSVPRSPCSGERCWVATRSGALAQQLQLEMPTIVRALNGRLGADAVKRLRFTAMS